MHDGLFGHVPQNGELFNSSGLGFVRVAPPVAHTPDTIRALMHALLAEARAATVLPWNAQELRAHTDMFPYMAEWLKGGEGDGLMDEFKAEMDRLAPPVDQVAPNWRDISGLAP